MTQPAQLTNSTRCPVVEFPGGKTWDEVAAHARRLPGVAFVSFVGDGEQSRLRFDYQGYDFCIRQRNDQFALSVEDAACPQNVLEKMHGHFAAT
jgi:hypothetical protein